MMLWIKIVIGIASFIVAAFIFLVISFYFLMKELEKREREMGESQ